MVLRRPEPAPPHGWPTYIMNQRVAFLGFQELADVRRTDLQFQSGGYTIERLDALTFHLLTVLVKVNEAGCDYKSAGMHDAPPAQRFGRNASYFAVPNANVSHPVQPSFGINDTTALEHEIVLLRRRYSRQKQHEVKRKNQPGHSCSF